MRKSVFFPVSLALTLLLSLFASATAAAWNRQKLLVPDPAFEESEQNPGKAPDQNPCQEPGTDAVLVIDVSGSMKQSDPNYLSREAALAFVEKLSRTESSRVGLVTFSDALPCVLPLVCLDDKKQRESFNEKLRALEYTRGDTDIGAAVEEAVSLLPEETTSSRSRSILLLTDGVIDLPQAPDEEEAEKKSLTRALMAVEEAKQRGIVIHTVSLDLSGSMDEHLMNYMADSTGGIASTVKSASALKATFRSLSEFAANQSRKAAETEAETQEQPPEEEQTQAQTEPLPVVQAIGSITGPVTLKGFLPDMCKATLHLSDLFVLENAPAGSDASLRFTAYPDDLSLLSCSIDNEQLLLEGHKNGTVLVTVIAQSPFTVADHAAAGQAQVPEAPASSIGKEEPDQMQKTLTFQVQVHAIIPSVWYLLLVPAGIGFLLITILLIRKKNEAPMLLSGFLQWYVRGENEKIFGMPAQTGVSLNAYGSKVRLSELIQDDLLQGAPLQKVHIIASDMGILVISKTPSIALARPGKEPSDSLSLTRSGKFKVFCEAPGGRAVIIALYTPASEYQKEPSAEDDSEERTRLLI